MDIPTTHPKPLSPGDTIGIIAPASTVAQRDALDQGITTLRRLGFNVRCEERIFQARRYLAGADADRVEELHRHFEDPGVQAIVALRGGFGCSRLIPLLEERRLRHNCKIFMGFSDITTLHLYFRRRFGWVTLHGPMMTSALMGNPGPEDERHLLSLWTDPGYLPRFDFPELETWCPGTAEGRLTGGCLSVLVASLGTAYEIKTDGKILFLEDLGEEPYRLDRMLTHLKLAGKLEGLAGILVGTFEDCEPESGEYAGSAVLREILEELQIPVLANFPAGHGVRNWAVPFGVKVRLDASNRSLEFLEAFVK